MVPLTGTKALNYIRCQENKPWQLMCHSTNVLRPMLWVAHKRVQDTSICICLENASVMLLPHPC